MNNSLDMLYQTYQMLHYITNVALWIGEWGGGGWGGSRVTEYLGAAVAEYLVLSHPKFSFTLMHTCADSFPIAAIFQEDAKT